MSFRGALVARKALQTAAQSARADCRDGEGRQDQQKCRRDDHKIHSRRHQTLVSFLRSSTRICSSKSRKFSQRVALSGKVGENRRESRALRCSEGKSRARRTHGSVARVTRENRSPLSRIISFGLKGENSCFPLSPANYESPRRVESSRADEAICIRLLAPTRPSLAD